RYRQPVGSGLARRRDLRARSRSLTLHLPCHRRSWPDCRCLYVANPRHGAARTFFKRAIASTGTTPRRVITDKAGTYPPALVIAVPGVRHRTGRYRTDGIERDHGFLKERLRPMRGLKSISSTVIFRARSRFDAEHRSPLLSGRRVSSAAVG